MVFADGLPLYGLMGLADQISEDDWSTVAKLLCQVQLRRSLSRMNNQHRRTNFTPSDDALIRLQPTSGIGLRILETILRTNRAALMHRADELGVSLVIRSDHDGAMDTRTFCCTDGFVDPLLARLKQVHGDRK